MPDQATPTPTQPNPPPAPPPTPTEPADNAEPADSLSAALAAYIADKDLDTFAAYLKANPPAAVKKSQPDWTSDTAGGFPQPGTVQEIDAKFHEGKITAEEMRPIREALRQAFGARTAAQPDVAPTDAGASGPTGAPAAPPPAQG
jgi:hypothetical protein